MILTDTIWIAHPNKFSSVINSIKKFQISELLGFGLNFKTNTTNQFLFLIKDDGILPFIDFLEYVT